MKNFIQPGNTVTVTAPSAVVAGELITVGSLVGVAAYTADSGAEVEIVTEGIFTLPKVPANAVLMGDRLYWDSSLDQATNVAGTGSKPFIGIAIHTADSGIGAVDCRLTLTGVTGPA